MTSFCERNNNEETVLSFEGLWTYPFLPSVDIVCVPNNAILMTCAIIHQTVLITIDMHLY